MPGRPWYRRIFGERACLVSRFERLLKLLPKSPYHGGNEAVARRREPVSEARERVVSPLPGRGR